MTDTASLKPDTANPSQKQIEAAAIAIHAHGDEGAWAACSIKDFWRGYAKEALVAALAASPLVEEARKTVHSENSGENA